MRRPARFRNYYRKKLSRQQRRNRWLLYVGLVLLAVVGNRLVEQPGWGRSRWWGRRNLKPKEILTTSAYSGFKLPLEE